MQRQRDGLVPVREALSGLGGPVKEQRAPRTDASERLTAAWLHVFDTPRGDRIAYRPDPAGDLVAWLSQDQLDRVIAGRR